LRISRYGGRTRYLCSAMTSLRFATASKTLREIPDRPIALWFISYL
jgi:hypothetical protein